ACQLPYTYTGASRTFTYTLVTVPAHGMVQAVAGGPALSAGATTTNGSLYYVSNAGYTGPDSFTWKLNDGVNSSNTATVGITVSPSPKSPPVYRAGVKLMDGSQPLRLYRRKEQAQNIFERTNSGYDWANTTARGYGIWMMGMCMAAPEVVDWNND